MHHHTRHTAFLSTQVCLFSIVVRTINHMGQVQDKCLLMDLGIIYRRRTQRRLDKGVPFLGFPCSRSLGLHLTKRFQAVHQRITRVYERILRRHLRTWSMMSPKRLSMARTRRNRSSLYPTLQVRGDAENFQRDVGLTKFYDRNFLLFVLDT
jgi:hypothetical protein